MSLIQNIYINKKEEDSIEFEKDEIAIPIIAPELILDIGIFNEGYPTHIHFSTDDALRDVISFSAIKHADRALRVARPTERRRRDGLSAC